MAYMGITLYGLQNISGSGIVVPMPPVDPVDPVDPTDPMDSLVPDGALAWRTQPLQWRTQYLKWSG